MKGYTHIKISNIAGHDDEGGGGRGCVVSGGIPRTPSYALVHTIKHDTRFVYVK